MKKTFLLTLLLISCSPLWAGKPTPFPKPTHRLEAMHPSLWEDQVEQAKIPQKVLKYIQKSDKALRRGALGEAIMCMQQALSAAQKHSPFLQCLLHIRLAILYDKGGFQAKTLYQLIKALIAKSKILSYRQGPDDTWGPLLYEALLLSHVAIGCPYIALDYAQKILQYAPYQPAVEPVKKRTLLWKSRIEEELLSGSTNLAQAPPFDPKDAILWMSYREKRFPRLSLLLKGFFLVVCGAFTCFMLYCVKYPPMPPELPAYVGLFLVGSCISLPLLLNFLNHRLQGKQDIVATPHQIVLPFYLQKEQQSLWEWLLFPYPSKKNTYYVMSYEQIYDIDIKNKQVRRWLFSPQPILKIYVLIEGLQKTYAIKKKDMQQGDFDALYYLLILHQEEKKKSLATQKPKRPTLNRPVSRGGLRPRP